MKVFLWIYGVVSAMYFVMYAGGAEIVVREVVGWRWLMMMVGVGILFILMTMSIAEKLYATLTRMIDNGEQ